MEDTKNIEIVATPNVATSNNVQNILPLDKKYVFPQKIDKTIEIVIVPKLDDITANQKNVGIVLDEKLILNILSKRYRNVSITEINTENDLKKLALRKPDLVFSGVKYFYFDSGITSYSKLSIILFSVGLLLVYFSSTAYHYVNKIKIKKRLQIFDHVSIYYLILGSYAPVCLITLYNSSGVLIFLIVLFMCLWSTSLFDSPALTGSSKSLSPGS